MVVCVRVTPGMVRRHLDEQPVERARVLGPHLEQVRVFAGDPVALEDLADVQHLLGEAIEEPGVLDAHPDEGGDVEAEARRVDPCGVAPDHAALLELADPLGDCRLREAHGLGKLALRGPTVLLEQVYEADIDRVHGTYNLFVSVDVRRWIWIMHACCARTLICSSAPSGQQAGAVQPSRGPRLFRSPRHQYCPPMMSARAARSTPVRLGRAGRAGSPGGLVLGLDAGRPSVSHAAPVKGKICMVTGVTSGIGAVTARELARMGATVLAVARNETKGRHAVAEIEASTPGADVRLMLCDLSSQESIRALAEQAKQAFDHLDVLVNNAGAILGERKLTVDGIEATFATNHLGYFLLTKLLLDLLRAGGRSRIVSVASEAHRAATLDLHDLQYERRPYSPFGAYNASKLANIAWSSELARRLDGTRITANTLHPGVIRSSFGNDGPRWLRLGMRLVRPLLTSPERGAETSLFLATSPAVEGVTGKYFKSKKPATPAAKALDGALQQKLWTESQEMTSDRKPGALS